MLNYNITYSDIFRYENLEMKDTVNFQVALVELRITTASELKVPNECLVLHSSGLAK